ncbi:hypothetical protein [Dyella tabacisoli]|uniref:MalT-like TPR region domain-containing protein n=1 Tax=Dyella tabacisoli TaxID=2282381 RepID=A0A369UQN6_9GAMM|nr:hypothetical protein [Dyella tabacisoli]RDD83072.1 hypothetical protein DVJ77_00135 [Dyella tabacisoli]
MQTTEQRLRHAREQGEPSQLAFALAEHAEPLARSGRLHEARDLLDEAAALHHQLQHDYDEVRCTHLAATLSRIVGDLEGACERARRALEQASPHTPEAVSAAAELAESLGVQGDAELAAEYWRLAITHAEAAGALATSIAAMQRRRAMLLASREQWASALDALSEARALYRAQGEAGDALRTLIEITTALGHQGQANEAHQRWQEAWAEAQAQDDPQARSDLRLLQASLLLQENNVGSAREAAAQARQAALDASMPVNYVAASMMISELAEHAQAEQEAYAALATGWATLIDLLGREAAAETFRPPLQALRSRLGDERFTAAKHAYEEQQRQARVTIH